MWDNEKIREAYKDRWKKYGSEESETRKQMFQSINSGQRAEIEKNYAELLETKKRLEDIGENMLGFSKDEIRNIKKEYGVYVK